MKDCFIYVEWYVTNIEKAVNFYKGMFNWKFEKSTDDYMMFEMPNGESGGITEVEKVNPGNSPAFYIHADHIENYLEKAPSLGGSVTTGKTELPGMGFYAFLDDPDGNKIGLYEDLKQ